MVLAVTGQEVFDAGGSDRPALPPSISEYLHAVNRSDDLPATLLASVRTAVRIADADCAVILVTGESDTKLEWGGHHGHDLRPLSNRTLDLDPRFGQLLVKAKGLITPDDSSLDPSFMSQLEMCGVRSPYALAPLKKEGTLLGVLVLGFQRRVPVALRENSTLDSFLTEAAHALSRTRAIATLRRKVDQLSAVAALTDAVSNAPSFEETLGHIIKQVKQLADAEQAGLLLINPETGDLDLQKPVGAREELIRQCRLPLNGGGSSVHVFRTGQPRMSNDPNDAVPSPRFVRLYGVRNVISVPLDVDHRRIGVFHVVNKRSGDFTEDDLSLVCLLASHVAVLIENALLLEEQRRTVNRLQELNQITDRQREGLARTLAVHDELTRVVLDGKGIAGIAATLSRLLANPVAVEDRFSNLLAYYPMEDSDNLDEGWRRTISEGRTSEVARNDPTVRAAVAGLGQRQRPVRLSSMPHIGLDQPRVIAPIVVGWETMGFVCVLESNRSLDEMDFMTVERAAIAMAVQMMKEKATVEAQYKLHADLVTELLSGNYGAEEALLERAAYLGIDLRVAHTVMVIEADGAPFDLQQGREKTLALKERLRAVMERACGRVLPESVVSGKGDEIIVLAKTASAAEGRTNIAEAADALRAEVSRWLPEITVSVGIGGECSNLAEYGQSYQQARTALEAIAALRQRDRTLAFDNLGIYPLLFDPHNRATLVRFVEGTVGTLLAYDRRHNMRLLETLHQYLLQNCRMDQTAQALNVHFNTLRYRLQRIAEITKTDLNNMETRCYLHLALKVVYGLRLT